MKPRLKEQYCGLIRTGRVLLFENHAPLKVLGGSTEGGIYNLVTNLRQPML